MSTPRRVTLSVVPALVALIALPGAHAAAQRAASADTAFATISGTVYDSLSGRPLAGALVQLAPRGSASEVLSARTDVDGAFTISGVRPDSYLVGFVHPALDSLGLEIPPKLLVVGSAEPLQISLGIPTQFTIRSSLCPNRQPEDSTGLLFGFIRDADTGAELDSGTVTLGWTEIVMDDERVHADRRYLPVVANSAGWFAICDLSTAGPISARAELGGNSSRSIEITVPPRGALHRDFNIPSGSAAVAVTDTIAGVALRTVYRGSARLAGTVSDEKGRPLAGVQIVDWGSGVTGATGADGKFALGNLPAGTQMLEARYVGYAPKRVAVDLVSGRTVSVSVTMDERADVLRAVTVYGKNVDRNRKIGGFEKRRAQNFGHFMTRADIAKLKVERFTDLLRTVPGIRLVSTGLTGYTIISSRGAAQGGACEPQVYIDGTRLVDASDLDIIVSPDDVAGIEVYAGASETPPEFTAWGECGSIVIWTGPTLQARAPD
ncbi:MAG TPA: carboxypeptidase regulatory-like domain-containing protein [Gemmatimonadaceae bacterium]|nr:carboxypeptidase regulatory-like domain-containing protein [Gemmatimonadaceae bacterium]